MATLGLSGNTFGRTIEAVECITDGLGSNSSLLEIDLSSCRWRSEGVFILVQTTCSRNTTLQKLTLDKNFISFTGVGGLLDMMEQKQQLHHGSQAAAQLSWEPGSKSSS